MQLFLFPEEAFRQSKVHKNDAKLDKHNSKGKFDRDIQVQKFFKLLVKSAYLQFF